MRHKIDISNWNIEVKDFFDINKYSQISSNLLINNFINKHHKELGFLVNKIWWYELSGNFEKEEIYNYILSILTREIELYHHNFQHRPFEKFWWLNLRYKSLNHFNKIKNRQYQFETKVSNNNLNLSNLFNKIQRTLDGSEKIVAFEEKMKQLQKLLDPKEKECLDQICNKNDACKFSKNKVNTILKSIRQKYNQIDN